MQFIKTWSNAALALGAAVTITSASAANVLLNSGFESATSQTTGNSLGTHADVGGTANYAGATFGDVTSAGVTNWTQSQNGTTVTNGVAGGNRTWYAKENTATFPGLTGNTYAVRLDANTNSGINALVYSTTISLSAGDTLNFSLDAWRELGNNTLFATLFNGTDTISLLGSSGTSITGLNNYSNAAPITVTNSGNYTLSINAATSGNNHLYVDNLNLDVTPIPEPSVTAIIGLAGLGLILRKRR